MFSKISEFLILLIVAFSTINMTIERGEVSIVEVEKLKVVEKDTKVVIELSKSVSERALYTSEDLYYLTEMIYFEARSEPVECMAQAAYTVLNRVTKRDLSIKEAILEPFQYSYTKDGKPELMKDEDARLVSEAVAKLVLNRNIEDRTMGGEYYYAHNIVDWEYKRSYKLTMVCGNHTFMR